MATFVLEIGSEELPSRFLASEEHELKERFAAAMDAAGLGYGCIRVMSTPRRAVVMVEHCAVEQSCRETIIIGPPVRVAYDAKGNPTKALEGFVRTNACVLKDVFTTTTEKGAYVAVRKRTGGAPAEEFLATLCPSIITALPFAKRMRWGKHVFAYARPLRWILALLDDRIVQFTLGPMTSGRATYGHRIHGPGPFTVRHADDFFDILTEKGSITLDSAARRRSITAQADAEAAKIGGHVLWKDALLDEVQGLVEHPVTLLGDFDETYLEVPREVLLASMETHQKSFGVARADGTILPHFITVLNLTPKDMSLVKRGWERVLRARLEDARFFWRTDLKENFDHWLHKLDTVIFMGGLGSMGDKSRRLEALCRWLAGICSPQQAEEAARAGRLSKADLVSGMVGEFDTLQGIMGGIYAARKGESQDVATALGEQYLPAGPDSPMPSSLLGAILSMADKADTLAGCFGLGMIPTGVADPNGLRRCALGIIRILLDFHLDVDVRTLFTQAQQLYVQSPWKMPPQEALDKLLSFFAARLRHYFLHKGYDTLLVDASLGAGIDRVKECGQRLEALAVFSQTPDFQTAVRTFKRVANILRKQAHGEVLSGQWEPSLLQEDAEKALAHVLEGMLPRLDRLWAAHDHTAALRCLNEVRPNVDAFFDSVMVMCDERALRQNRLNMLQALGMRFARLADFAALQV